jgi:hypothetical protein
MAAGLRLPSALTREKVESGDEVSHRESCLLLLALLSLRERAVHHRLASLRCAFARLGFHLLGRGEGASHDISHAASRVGLASAFRREGT